MISLVGNESDMSLLTFPNSGNTYYFRSRIPIDLIEHFGGLSEFRVSLKCAIKSRSIRTSKILDKIVSKIFEETRVGNMEYLGEYKDGKKHGKGSYTWSDGGIYVGNWKEGKQHGHGTYTTPAGRKYVGEWKEGKYDGQGTETLSNGWKYVGEWREGKPWNIKIYGKTGIIIMEYVNGVEQK